MVFEFSMRVILFSCELESETEPVGAAKDGLPFGCQENLKGVNH